MFKGFVCIFFRQPAFFVKLSFFSMRFRTESAENKVTQHFLSGVGSQCSSCLLKRSGNNVVCIDG